MTLALRQPFPPMDALPVKDIPLGKQWQYEPKWDGFRCIVFRDGAKVVLQSKSGQSLTRYFPELVEAVAAIKMDRFVLDGEIVVPHGAAFSFDLLLQRIHPAASRITRLANETPAELIFFDLLLTGREKLIDEPLQIRRKALEKFAGKYLRRRKTFHLSPATTNSATAEKWLSQAGPKLDGVIAKRRDMAYQSGNRFGMQKIKKLRTADCVVGGFRYGEREKIVASLLLGLFDNEGLLNHVGFTSALKAAEKKKLTAKLESLIQSPGFTGAKPGGPSRWTTKRSADWSPLQPKLVVEVYYDHFSGGRFRHGTRFLRWRPDKAPRQCTFAQIGDGRQKASRARP